LFGVLSPVSVESSSVPDISTQSNTIPPPQQGRHQNTGLHRAGPVEDSNDEFEKEIPINSNDSKLPSPRIKSSPISPPSHHIPSASSSASSSSSIAPRSLQTATASMKSAELDQDKSKSLLEKNGDDDDEEDNSRTNPRTLMLIRLLFITYYGSLGSLMPYLPVYYHSLGHGGQAIGMLGAVKPLTTFIVAPLWGVISDYSQNPSLILQLTFLASLVLQLMIPLKDEVHYLMGMVFLTALFNAPVKSLIDGMVMNKLSPVDRGQYGKLRLWGQLGFGLGSSIVGATISRSTSTSSATMAENAMNTKIQKSAIETMKAFISNPLELISNLQGYQLAFLAYALMSIPSFIAVQSFRNAGHDTQNVDKAKKITKTDTSPKISEGIKMLLHNGDALLFFSLVLVVGITSGIIENFAYVRLREVGGSGKEMGLCRLVSSLCGAPMFWFSGPLTAKLGADRVLVLSLLSYVFRFLNYALMKHPFHALPAEGMRGIAFAAFWSTGTIFAHKISPPGMSVTMVSFLLRCIIKYP
jgi:MFS-type transporter involved in bile tolerance (Atg22 family)